MGFDTWFVEAVAVAAAEEIGDVNEQAIRRPHIPSVLPAILRVGPLTPAVDRHSVNVRPMPQLIPRCLLCWRARVVPPLWSE